MRHYEVFDALNPSILSPSASGIYQAASGADAVRMFMREHGIAGTIKRSASRFVRFCATPFIPKDGFRYRDGRQSWFEYLA